MKNVYIKLVFAISFVFVSEAIASVKVIDFDTTSNGDVIGNGQVVDDEYALDGVTITSFIRNGSIYNKQVAFDTNHSSIQDPDLEFNKATNDYNSALSRTPAELNDYDPNYSYSALDIPAFAGDSGYQGDDSPDNVLIMQNAQRQGNCTIDNCPNPDDENTTDPAGYFEFTFDTLVDIISLDTFDVEDNGEFVIQFFANNTLVATNVETVKSTGDTVEILHSPDYVVQSGDATLLTMGDGQFVRQILNITGIDRMKIQLPGSGAIDNLAFRPTEVPAPASFIIFALSILFMAKRKSTQVS